MAEPRRIAVLTTGRQDWGLLCGLCERLQDSDDFELVLLAGGMACSRHHGRIVHAIESQGFELAELLEWSLDQEVEAQSAEAVSMVGAALRRHRPRALVLLGDRHETAAAALASTLLRIPIVHLCGGEETEGSIDNALRHAVTKLSHLHFVTHAIYGQRVLDMGEAAEAVHVVGSTSVDNCLGTALPTRDELERELGLKLKPPVGLVTVHPTTLAEEASPSEVDVVLAAIRDVRATWVITLPNADPGHGEIRAALRRFEADTESTVVVDALGARLYLGVMQLSDVVVGNSSSGIVEAPAFGVPTVNVGDRQKGRIRGPSIIDVPADVQATKRALVQALSRDFRETVRSGASIFGDGSAADRMLAILSDWEIPVPPRKAFGGTAELS